MDATIRRAGPTELEQVRGFYRAHEYEPSIEPADIIVLAEVGGELCGAVRICQEQGTLVLRGMRIRKELRRQGLGSRLLRALEPVIGERECWCIPLRYLSSFYGKIGFVEIEADGAPSFLSERCAGYRRDHGLDVIVMHRPGGLQERDQRKDGGYARQNEELDAA